MRQATGDAFGADEGRGGGGGVRQTRILRNHRQTAWRAGGSIRCIKHMQRKAVVESEITRTAL